MIVHRLTRAKYAKELSGIGAKMAGGRWNSRGIEVIYTAANRSLAMAEIAVHLSYDLIPHDYMMLDIYIPDHASMEKLTPSELKDEWHLHPPKEHTKQIGDHFITTGKSLLLMVPSAVVKGDYNLLINPFHNEFSKVKILESEHFPFDRRIFK